MRLPTVFRSKLKDPGRLSPVDEYGGKIRDLADRDLPYRDLGIPVEKMIFTAELKNKIQWVKPVHDRQRIFLNHITEIAKHSGTHLVYLNSPFQSDWATPGLKERANGIWVDHPEVPLIGVDPSDIKALYTAEEEEKFFDDIHLHPSGAKIFSRWIGPALRKVYESN
jgi:hypothetical protein